MSVCVCACASVHAGLTCVCTRFVHVCTYMSVYVHVCMCVSVYVPGTPVLCDPLSFTSSFFPEMVE